MSMYRNTENRHFGLNVIEFGVCKGGLRGCTPCRFQTGRLAVPIFPLFGPVDAWYIALESTYMYLFHPAMCM